ncbi:hypothetical protein Q5P01_007994 [Channa striata]|uniref:Uncharacterized protein n=1 Tax=Channa striata TaxID=64152 RepID=A0AA88N5T7_CHASR|nr:hypothetical protein Q5P01_007994 [Channa striata]
MYQKNKGDFDTSSCGSSTIRSPISTSSHQKDRVDTLGSNSAFIPTINAISSQDPQPTVVPSMSNPYSRSHPYGLTGHKTQTRPGVIRYIGDARGRHKRDEQSLSVPLEILEELFLNLPPDQVVRVCRLVCRQWKGVADSEALWRERCRREGYHLHEASRTPTDWRRFYFLCMKRRNLIQNPRAEEGFQGWQILANGGDKWKIEGVCAPHPNKGVQKNFVTSYIMCWKSQLIDLEKEGYSPSFMDHFQPDIRISDWYAPRRDCGSQYEIRVKLLNQVMKPVQTFAPDTVYFQCGSDQKWHQMAHVFQNYGPGVRYIRFTHGGKDIQFWAGWYGIRLTDSSVEICPAADT